MAGRSKIHKMMDIMDKHTFLVLYDKPHVPTYPIIKINYMGFPIQQ